ncbi:MAG: MBL fold metallo-hydrolase [Bacteroidetes bacterium]|nr:MBL fold metallo-hydrolase [Bacteroidota bacterium]
MSVLNFLTPGAIPQEEFDAIEIEVHEVAPGILMLVGQGGNIGVSYGEDSVFMVDAQFGQLTEKILAAINTHMAKPVQFVLNTHWHGDHVGGNENFSARGALIMAHEKVHARLSVDQFLGAFGSKVPAAPKGALPVITFTENISFHWNGDTIEIFHAPEAHTDGDVIVHFHKANVIHMGDTYFNGMYPFIDVDTGGSIDGMVAVADAVLARCDENTRVIPGHGPLSNQSELQAYREMMATVREAVAKLIREDKSREEIIAAKPTAALDAAWDGGVLDPDTYVGHIYNSLTGTSAE